MPSTCNRIITLSFVFRSRNVAGKIRIKKEQWIEYVNNVHYKLTLFIIYDKLFPRKREKERERGGEGERERGDIYIYIYIERERERERKKSKKEMEILCV